MVALVNDQFVAFSWMVTTSAALVTTSALTVPNFVRRRCDATLPLARQEKRTTPHFPPHVAYFVSRADC